jgi:pyridoxal phosphate enzyme (YggS family)
MLAPMNGIVANIESLRVRIATAAERAGRDPSRVKLVGASKSVEPERIAQALDAGLQDFGENFIQEAAAHIDALGGRANQATWHFIGHLQTNKVSVALRRFDILQSVDSVRLAQDLNRRATSAKRILLEVNVAAETSKFGFDASEVGEAVRQLAQLPNLDLAGLMTIAPEVPDPEQVRPVFRTLQALAQANGLAELSMGMTDDFEVAVEEGATMVRVGRAIFGERTR